MDRDYKIDVAGNKIEGPVIDKSVFAEFDELNRLTSYIGQC